MSTILFVEENRTWVNLLVEWLEQTDDVVIGAESLEKGKQLYESKAPDAVLVGSFDGHGLKWVQELIRNKKSAILFSGEPRYIQQAKEENIPHIHIDPDEDQPIREQMISYVRSVGCRR